MVCSRWRWWSTVDGCRELWQCDFLFLFLFFNFCFIFIYFYFLGIFLPCFMLTWAIFCFFLQFFVFLMFTVFGIPDVERRKKRNLLIGQPQGSLSESRWFVYLFKFKVYIFLWLAYLKINSWSVQMVYCGCRECCVCRECDCRYSHVPRGCVASRAFTSVLLGTGFCHGWVEGKRAAVFCRCGWMMEWKELAKWNVFVFSPIKVVWRERLRM